MGSAREFSSIASRQAPTLSGLAAALVADPERGPRVQRAAELLGELADLSDDEVDAMLEEDE